MAEKMLAGGAIQGLIAYPSAELHEALLDLVTAQFHDILPGSSVQFVEEAALRLIGHGLETVSRLKGRAFFALTSGQRKARNGEIPILVYNPHPFPVKGIFECEFNLIDAEWQGKRFSCPIVYKNGTRLPSQPGKEHHNINIDWRRQAVFEAELSPSQMNRFDCRFEIVKGRPKPQLKERDGRITFENRLIHVVINAQTGLLDRYRVDGFDYLKRNACEPLVIRDTPDSWASTIDSFREVEGAFQCMAPDEGTRFSGVTEGILPSVRVVDDGEVRSVIEAVLRYRDSFICQTYLLPKEGAEVELHIRVYWNEKDRMLKLSLPTVFDDGAYIGQVAYGVATLPADGTEAVSQKWVAVVSEPAGHALTCINDCQYGSDYKDGEIRLSLLRSPAYASHYFPGAPLVLPDRFTPRMDQGERCYRLWFNGGPVQERMERVDREALAHNEKPFAVSMFPSGEGVLPKPTIILDDNAVQMTALKKAEESGHFIVRLFEPTGLARTTTLNFPSIGVSHRVDLGKFEIKTLRLDAKAKTLTEVGLMEE
jgi:alpha-mannosidase